MPFIEQNDLVKLYDEIEDLTEKKEELRKGYIDLKLENNKLLKKEKIKTIILVVLLLVLLFFGFMLYQLKKGSHNDSFDKNEFLNQKIDSIEEVYSARQEEDLIEEKHDLIYTIQIGAFKELNIRTFDEEELKNFLKIPNKDLYTYSIGQFYTFNQANIFLSEIKKIGIKDAFILPLKNNERISLKEAKEEENNK
ncbi:SPOR domain-containing protein [Tenacibaculum sp. IB213877]|uniref:SPOR domain-containing protein n=1 Tax=Tenacibaculum sp. IB213877 TaxID=3097351 RepID=UPI002A5ADFC5|nr:SPOR domain-containing protein [Tenacibaculum sp. IB213877]MDY0780009.1 SPOR domain-containing protein [Tenacibaculum sp. IB213877]